MALPCFLILNLAIVKMSFCDQHTFDEKSIDTTNFTASQSIPHISRPYICFVPEQCMDVPDVMGVVSLNLNETQFGSRCISQESSNNEYSFAGESKTQLEKKEATYFEKKNPPTPALLADNYKTSSTLSKTLFCSLSPVTTNDGQLPEINYNSKSQEKPNSRQTKNTQCLTLESQSSTDFLPHQRPYKRSRNGCLTCRHRKRKCCEIKPVCQECTRLGIKCEWPVVGFEYKNKSKQAKKQESIYFDEYFGEIKKLRGTIDGKRYSTW